MSSRRRRRNRRRRSGRRATSLKLSVALLGAALLVLLSGAVTAVAVATTWLEDLPDIDSPDAFAVAQTTRIYAADGQLLASLYLENRELVRLSEIATDLVEATVAVEDERFYQHDGVDYYGTVRAAVVDLLAGSIEEGASTLTQQYVDNTILLEEKLSARGGMERWRTKFREMWLAVRLEERYEKDDILNFYLNTVYFGEGAYGAEAAARTYFGKHADELTLAEAAMLAGIPQSPTYNNPYDYPEAAKARQEWVLAKMVENGFVTQAIADEAAAVEIELTRVESTAGVYDAPYFVAHVKKILQEQYSMEAVFGGGLRVHTTLDPEMQSAAEEAVAAVLDRPDDPDAALVAVEPQTGYVRALVGGRDWTTNKFNLATQGRRQPGSSFKTFVLVTALEEGMPPWRMINASSPAILPTTPTPWRVYGGRSGYITMQSATVSSVNCAYARLIMELGADKVARTAERMGISPGVPAFPSIALGSHNVSPLDMASAYSTLANDGVHNDPVTITRIEDSHGNVLYEHEVSGTEVLDPKIAYAATDVLRGVIRYGTGRAANIGRDAAGKTGTSQTYRDAWFVGYTPQLSTAVWMGYYDREIPMDNVHGRRVFGGTFPAEIWAKFMSKALEGEPKLTFTSHPRPEYSWKPEWSEPETETVEPAPAPKPDPTPPPTPPPPPPPDPEPTTTPPPTP